MIAREGWKAGSGIRSTTSRKRKGIDEGRVRCRKFILFHGLADNFHRKYENAMIAVVVDSRFHANQITYSKR